jgi:predicted RNA-binding protein with RPS1 domain
MLENKAVGLLHISHATEKLDKNIYEIVKLDDQVEVEVINIDEVKLKVAFKLIKVI